jgi:hypothetical protein
MRSREGEGVAHTPRGRLLSLAAPTSPESGPAVVNFSQCFSRGPKLLNVGPEKLVADSLTEKS